MPKILIALSFFVAILSSPHALMAGQANLVLDAGTGEVLASENADRLNHPASLTKMMTLYMTFEAIKRGKLSWDQPVRFSKYAASRPPTKLHVKAGDSVTVREAVMGMIIVSANDAASAMAETLGGSSWQIALRVVLPQTLPRLFTCLRLQLGPAWLFLIAAEAISADSGLGYRIFLVRRYLSMDVIFPYVAWITLLAVIMNFALDRARIAIFPWSNLERH